jgi:hypothetical protein
MLSFLYMEPSQDQPIVVTQSDSSLPPQIINDAPKSNILWVAGGVVVALLVTGILLSVPLLSPTPSHELSGELNAGSQSILTVPTPKGVVEFEKKYEISANEGVTPRGYIAGSTNGKQFWVADGKLAYVVTYFTGPNNSNAAELFYDGKKVDIHDGDTHYNIKNDFIQGVPEITDRLAFYTFNLDKFFFGDQVFAKQGVIFDAASIGGKLALRSQGALALMGN